jgi:DNA-binding NarL/FixJ family response regulator
MSTDNVLTHAQSITVLLAEPHGIARSGLRLALEAHPRIRIIGETGSGTEALALIEANHPDIVILEFMLTELNGVQVIHAIQRQLPEAVRPNVLVFSGNESRARIISAIAAGARGYLLKREHTSQLVEAILRISQGHTALSASVQDRLIEFVGQQQHEITNREFEVFQLMARGRSDAEIAHELNITENTVNQHLRNICRKLPFIRNRAEAAAWAWMNELIEPSATPHTFG